MCLYLFCTYFLPSNLYLSEDTEPDNKDINVEIKKGKTKGTPGCFNCLRDKTVSYIT